MVLFPLNKVFVQSRIFQLVVLSLVVGVRELSKMVIHPDPSSARYSALVNPL